MSWVVVRVVVQVLLLPPVMLRYLCLSGAAAHSLCKRRSWYLVKAPRGATGPHSSRLCSTVALGDSRARVWPGHCPAMCLARLRAPWAFSKQILVWSGTNCTYFKGKYWAHQDYQLNMFQHYNTSVNRKMEPMQRFLPAGARFQNDHLWKEMFSSTSFWQLAKAGWG